MVRLVPSNALTRSLPATAPIDRAPGPVVSTTIAVVLALSTETLPAASVWRTFTAPLAYVPADNVKLVPAPAAQFIPTSVLYSQVVSRDKPVTLTRPSLVLPSVPKLPLSSTSPKTGAIGATVSSTYAWLNSGPLLPATSTTLTLSVLLPVSSWPDKLQVF